MYSEKRRFFESLINERIIVLKGMMSQEPIFPEVYPREPIKDENDLASEIVQNELDLALVHSSRTKILALQQALAKIRSGKFGVCEECDAPIPENRLMAKPESHLCIRCQEKMEKMSGYRRGH
jgi:DnaK suppressor protein